MVTVPRIPCCQSLPEMIVSRRCRPWTHRARRPLSWRCFQGSTSWPLSFPPGMSLKRSRRLSSTDSTSPAACCCEYDSWPRKSRGTMSRTIRLALVGAAVIVALLIGVAVGWRVTGIADEPGTSSHGGDAVDAGTRGEQAGQPLVRPAAVSRKPYTKGSDPPAIVVTASREGESAGSVVGSPVDVYVRGKDRGTIGGQNIGDGTQLGPLIVLPGQYAVILRDTCEYSLADGSRTFAFEVTQDDGRVDIHLNLVERPCPVIRGRVIHEESGEAVGPGKVQICDDHRRPTFAIKVPLDAEGRFEAKLGGMPAGRYYISTSRLPGGRRVRFTECDLALGDNEVLLVLPKPYAIEGTVDTSHCKKPPGSIGIVLKIPYGQQRVLRLGEERQFRFEVPHAATCFVSLELPPGYECEQVRCDVGPENPEAKVTLMVQQAPPGQ